jgi:hypothetical protein
MIARGDGVGTLGNRLLLLFVLASSTGYRWWTAILPTGRAAAFGWTTMSTS